MRKRSNEMLDKFRSLDIFSNCDDDELREIDSLTDEVQVPAGREIIRQGDLGREFIVIVNGEASVQRNGAEVNRLGPGAHFGELALLASIERNASVVALTDMTLDVIDRRAFQTLLEDSPHLTRNLLESTARRLAQADAAPD